MTRASAGHTAKARADPKAVASARASTTRERLSSDLERSSTFFDRCAGLSQWLQSMDLDEPSSLYLFMKRNVTPRWRVRPTGDSISADYIGRTASSEPASASTELTRELLCLTAGFHRKFLETGDPSTLKVLDLDGILAGEAGPVSTDLLLCLKNSKRKREKAEEPEDGSDAQKPKGFGIDCYSLKKDVFFYETFRGRLYSLETLHGDICGFCPLRFMMAFRQAFWKIQANGKPWPASNPVMTDYLRQEGLEGLTAEKFRNSPGRSTNLIWKILLGKEDKESHPKEQDQPDPSREDCGDE